MSTRSERGRLPRALIGFGAVLGLAGYYQQSGLPTRVFERHRGNKVLRWHWLCDVGE